MVNFLYILARQQVFLKCETDDAKYKRWQNVYLKKRHLNNLNFWTFVKLCKNEGIFFLEYICFNMFLQLNELLF